jgi:hypothetical protein
MLLKRLEVRYYPKAQFRQRAGRVSAPTRRAWERDGPGLSQRGFPGAW